MGHRRCGRCGRVYDATTRARLCPDCELDEREAQPTPSVAAPKGPSPVGPTRFISLPSQEAAPPGASARHATSGPSAHGTVVVDLGGATRAKGRDSTALSGSDVDHDWAADPRGPAQAVEGVGLTRAISLSDSGASGGGHEPTGRGSGTRVIDLGSPGHPDDEWSEAGETRVVELESATAAAEGHTLKAPTAPDTDMLAGWLVCVDGPQRGQDFRLFAGHNAVQVGAAGDLTVIPTAARGPGMVARVSCGEGAQPLSPGDSAWTFTLEELGQASARSLAPFQRLRLGGSTLVFVQLCGVEFGW